MDTTFFYTFGFLLCTSDQQKNIHFVWEHPMNIPARFGSSWPSGTREED